jgi:putative oxidoreductase
MSLGILVLRVVVGLLFVGHGAQKLFGAFGGDGPDGTAANFEQIGLRPGRVHAMAAGTMELVGGLLLTLGLLTPVGSMAIIAVMTAAILTVHGSKGIWNQDGGVELPLVMGAAAFAVAATGPGHWSLDHALGIVMTGAGWALAALAAGVLGAFGAVISGRFQEMRERRSEAPTTRMPPLSA